MASTSKTISAKIRLRKDTRANWETPTAGNIVLLDGEIAIVVNTDNSVNFKIGNGVTKFSSLPYLTFNDIKSKSIHIDNLTDLNIGNSTLSDILNLVPIYDGGTPQYTSWKCNPETYYNATIEIKPSGSQWMPSVSGSAIGANKGDANSTNLTWTTSEAAIGITATRTYSNLIGYKFNNQTDKILASEIEASLLRENLNKKADKTDIVLTPIYDGNGKQFNDWVCTPPTATSGGNTYTLVVFKYQTGPASYVWAIGSTPGTPMNVSNVTDPLAQSITFSLPSGLIPSTVTATRTVNKIIGYNLGNQTDKTLAPKTSIDSLKETKAEAQNFGILKHTVTFDNHNFEFWIIGPGDSRAEVQHSWYIYLPNGDFEYKKIYKFSKDTTIEAYTYENNYDYTYKFQIDSYGSMHISYYSDGDLVGSDSIEMDAALDVIPYGVVCAQIVDPDTVSELALVPVISKTWSELNTLVNNSQLVVGQQYRITDYVATTSQTYTCSANKPFDIIITANSANTFNENVCAIDHSGNTYFSSGGTSPSKWILKYCFKNDTNRFSWANTSGKGVIYYMKDEWNNECPYDFKGLKFGSTTVSSAFFTFSSSTTASTATDASLNGKSNYVFDNIIKECYNGSILKLNGNIFKGTYCYRNTLKENCYDNTFEQNCHDNIFEKYCACNKFGTQCQYNNFNIYCQYNTFGTQCQYNTFDGYCFNNNFGTYCRYNTFGAQCHYNTFGAYCQYNNFNQACSNNKFGTYCQYNTYYNNCCYIVTGSSTSNVKNYFRYITIEAGNNYIYLDRTTSNTSYCQNIKILSGYNNTTSYKSISISNVNQTYTSVYSNSIHLNNTVDNIYVNDSSLKSILNEKISKISNPISGNLAVIDDNGEIVNGENLRYSFVTKTINNGSVSLDDRCSNTVSNGSTENLNIDFPENNSNYARDFIMVLICNTTIPTITYTSNVTIAAEDPDSLIPEEGVNVYGFTEISKNKFILSRKLVENVVVQVPTSADQLLDMLNAKGIDTTNINTFGEMATALDMSDTDNITIQDIINKVCNDS